MITRALLLFTMRINQAENEQRNARQTHAQIIEPINRWLLDDAAKQAETRNGPAKDAIGRGPHDLADAEANGFDDGHLKIIFMVSRFFWKIFGKLILN